MGHDSESRRHAEVLCLHTEALDSFGRRVRAVAVNQWSARTPCTGWTVRDLVNHLTAEQLWVPELLAGATIRQIGGRFDGDVLGADPAAAWSSAARAAHEAFNAPGAMAGRVNLSRGTTSAWDYCSQMAVDATVHTWDLARATGGDTHLAPELVDFALRHIEPRFDGLAASGLFAPPVQVPADADAQTKLLAKLGRRTIPQHETGPEQTGGS